MNKERHDILAELLEIAIAFMEIEKVPGRRAAPAVHEIATLWDRPTESMNFEKAKTFFI